MDSEGSTSSRQPEQPAGTPQRKPSPLRFLVPAALVLLLAVAVAVTSPSTRHNLRLSLRSSLFSHRLLSPGLRRQVLRLLSPAPWKRDRSVGGTGRPTSPRPPCVLWMAPFLSGGGYSSEAWSYITALDRSMGEEEDPPIRLALEQHGDLENWEFWEGLPEGDRELAIRLHGTECRLAETVVVCHSEPGAWYPPLFETLPCPLTGYAAPLAVVGRTMFETDRLNPEHARRCNRMDAVWVPTGFHVSTFVASGVDPSKVVKVVQPVDVGFFDPSKYKPLALPAEMPVLGSVLGNPNVGPGRKVFVFLSIFKWERRKGWDVLLASYLREFTTADGVALYLLTNPYHTDKDFGNKISKFAQDAKLEEPGDGWAPVYVIDSHIAQADLPRLYKAADAFVLPSRGEGWGRPVVEAMAMELPVIVTNWSGPTEYLTEENGYPLPVDRMSKVPEGPFKGHLWAEPSVEQLRALMRRVVSNPEEAERRAARAREDMIQRFSPAVVARIVVDQILKVSKAHQ
ncbi:hypothetical protein Taro_010070 [Colocasia esculenta]|uniref:Glycosyl transferase family 1 domain-containing protein n=1 Tax=Colocasia esculenta TaxID=4460 RepID=A0A843U8G7_COLES|nr:hypothetical protein [Colocasia esculenta]